MSGFFGIGIENGKTKSNIGTLWRSANLLGASFIFVIGDRYKKQCSDTMKTPKSIPLYHYSTIEDFYKNGLPIDCILIGIELSHDAIPISDFHHPKRCVYLLGAEDVGLSQRAIETSHKLVSLPGKYSMNVSVAGSIVMFDRTNKG